MVEAGDPRGGGQQGLGLLLFLFIPLVLFLFVGQPSPLAVSLLAGVVLMVGHRRLARPYMRRVALRKCLWSNRSLPPSDEVVELELLTAAGVQPARSLRQHQDSVARFFTFAQRWRWPLRVGIFLPLLALLLTLAGAAAGLDPPRETVTQLFRLVIGLTVNVAAWGYLWQRPESPLRVPFPAHNFFLLGIRNLLWIFRLMGLWWIVMALRALGT